MGNVFDRIRIVEEHSVAIDLLPEKANILDAGCRGFEFTNYFRERGHNVLAIDIDKLDGDYMQLGVSHKAGIAFINKGNDPQAVKISEVRELEINELLEKNKSANEVYIVTIQGIKTVMGWKEIDLIKLDVEGEEFEILKNASHPIAKQISVEFHAHCADQNKEKLDSLLNWLSQWYTIYNQVWEERHCAGFNYWDVLLIEK